MTAAAQFGRLVRFTRKARKLKIWQVAERVGIEVKHLGRIERGERQPSFDLIVALAKQLQVSPSVFFDFESLSDPKTLRVSIEASLSELDPEQLRKAYRLIRALL